MAGVNNQVTAPSAATADAMSSRKRNVALAGMDSSPGSIDDGEDLDRDDKRRQPVKRACNECRQQKVRREFPPTCMRKQRTKRCLPV